MNLTTKTIVACTQMSRRYATFATSAWHFVKIILAQACVVSTLE